MSIHRQKKALVSKKLMKSHTEAGASLVEYALLVALIALVALVAVQTLGTRVSGRVSTAAGAVYGSTAATPIGTF
jgi:Flp pilus assembly pilin Flp